jgi:hypothetical protein
MRIMQPPADLAADLDAERLRIGGVDALADATGLHAQTIARIILREPVWHGSIRFVRNYLASQAVTS